MSADAQVSQPDAPSNAIDAAQPDAAEPDAAIDAAADADLADADLSDADLTIPDAPPLGPCDPAPVPTDCIPLPRTTASYVHELTLDSPGFHRPNGTTICTGLAMPFDKKDNTRYHAIRFCADETESRYDIQVEIKDDEACLGLTDSVAIAYSGEFNPAASLSECRGFNDDRGQFQFGSLITNTKADDDEELIVVVTAFRNFDPKEGDSFGQIGTYRLIVTKR